MNVVLLALLALAAEAPAPWQTVARIRVPRGDSTTAVGSAAIVSSTDAESIAITAGHLFRETPQLGHAVRVDLFDGQVRGSRPGRVAFTSTHPGQLLALEPIADLALVRFQAGRTLPAAPLVPLGWQAPQNATMTAVGCPDGRDATAWTARVIRQGRTLIECTHAPRLGRSGGGLYTPEGLLVGICNYADPNRDTGLYAGPSSIHRLLARHPISATTPTDPATAPDPPSQGNLPMTRPGLAAALLGLLAPTQAPAQFGAICINGVCQTPQSAQIQSFAAPQIQGFAAPQLSLPSPGPYIERHSIPIPFQADYSTTWTPQVRFEGLRQVGGYGAYAAPSVSLGGYAGTYGAYEAVPIQPIYPRRGWRRTITRYRTRTVDFNW